MIWHIIFLWQPWVLCSDEKINSVIRASLKERLLKIYGTSNYRKTPKNLDTRKKYCNCPKIWLIWILHRVMSPKDANGMANSVDPDQTAPVGAVLSGSILFAQTCLSENLGSLWYFCRIDSFSLPLSFIGSCCEPAMSDCGGRSHIRNSVCSQTRGGKRQCDQCVW